MNAFDPVTPAGPEDRVPPPGLGPGTPVVAFDIGGTDIKAAFFHEDGRIGETLRVPTPRGRTGDPAPVVAKLAALWDGFAEARHGATGPATIGVAVPGVVDEASGVCVAAENLGWVDVPLGALLHRHLDTPVAFTHDVRAAGLAEKLLGAAQPFDDCVVVIIGTGIACAIFTGGRLYAANGYAGEIGHIVIDPRGPACVCGQRGCLEALASAAAIARSYSERTGTAVRGAKEVLARASAGDPSAAAAWSQAIDALAIGLSHVVNILGPQAIIVGGGLSQAGNALLEPLTQQLFTRIGGQRRPIVRRAGTGQDAGLLGAALSARQAAASSPVTSGP